MFVVLDLQPGRADLLDQAKRYQPLLRLPHVGLAVDPEWKLRPGPAAAAPDRQHRRRRDQPDLGLAGRPVRASDLPQKLFVVHQFRLSMIGDEERLRTDHAASSALLVHMDGQGRRRQRGHLGGRRGRPAGGPAVGWKNFYDEDHPMFSPAETMARQPSR